VKVDDRKILLQPKGFVVIARTLLVVVAVSVAAAVVVVDVVMVENGGETPFSPSSILLGHSGS